MDKTVSTMFGNEITNEVSATISGIFSSKTNVKTTFQQTSTETWHEETTISDTISVKAGQSVVVWQYVYIGKYADQKINFNSNIFEHTKSLNDVPDAHF